MWQALYIISMAVYALKREIGSLNLIPTEKGTEIEKITKVRKQLVGTEVQLLFPSSIEIRESNLEWAEHTYNLTLAKGGKAPRRLSSPHWYDTVTFKTLLDSVKDKTKTIGEVIINIFGPYSALDISSNVLTILEKRLDSEMELEKYKELLQEMKRIYPEVRPDELGCVGILRDFPLREERKGFYKLEVSGKGKELLRIPYVVELWARPVKSKERSFFEYRSEYREPLGKVFLFVNKSYVPGEPSILEKESVLLEIGMGRISFLLDISDVKELLQKHCIMYLNITTPFIQTALDTKRPILPGMLESEIKYMFLSMFQTINNEKKFHKVRVTKTGKSVQKKQNNQESTEVISIFNSTNALIRDLLDRESIQYDKENLSKSVYLQVLTEDPFITGIKKPQIKKALWFKKWWSDFNPQRNRKHLRRFYYWVISQPDGKVICHDGQDIKSKSPGNAWDYVLESSKYARNLQLVDAFEIIDRRNPEPIGQVHRFLNFSKEVTPASWIFPHSKLYIPEASFIYPQLSIDEEAAIQTSAALQPVHLEIWTEKTTMNDILEPLCKEYGIRLVPYAGYASITSIDRFIEIAVSIPEKPSIIFYISDFDPAGENMPVTVARYLQHRIWLLKSKNLWPEKKKIFIQHILLTKQQMESDEFKTLPRAPVRKKKKYDGAHDDYDDTKPGTVELDALEALRPGRFRQIVLENIAKVFDMELAERVRKEISRIKEYFNSTIEHQLMPFKSSILSIENSINNIRKKYLEDLQKLINNMEDDIKDFIEEGLSIQEEINRFCKKLESELRLDIRTEKNFDLDNCLFDSTKPFKEQTMTLLDYRVFKRKSGKKK